MYIAYLDLASALSPPKQENTSFWLVLQKKGKFVTLHSKFSV